MEERFLEMHQGRDFIYYSVGQNAHGLIRSKRVERPTNGDVSIDDLTNENLTLRSNS